MTAVSLPTFRPLGLGELLDQAIRLYRRNFVRFIGIIAIIQAPLMLAQLGATIWTTRNLTNQVMNPDMTDPTELFSTMGAQYGVILIFGALSLVLVQGLATGALTRTIADERIGQTTGILEAYRKILPLLPTLVLTVVLFLVLMLVLLVWTLVPCIGWVSGVGMLAFGAMVLGQLLAPVVVVEKPKPLEAIRRAWELTRRRFWWVLGFMGALALFGYLIVAGPNMLIAMLLTATMSTGADLVEMNMLTTIVNSVTSLITTLLYQPLQLTAVTLLYFDLRVRTEGLDLAIEAQRDGGQELDLAAISAEAPAPAGETILTSKEFGYFVLLSMAGFSLYLALVVVIMILGLGFATLLGGF